MHRKSKDNNMRECKSLFRRVRWCSWCLLLCLLTCFLRVPDVLAAEPFELHLLDVGQGQSVLLKADGRYMLIDGGGRESSSFVVSYLRAQGVDALDIVAASHYDEDHIAGLIGALSAFPAKTLLLPDYEGEGSLYESFAASAASNGCDMVQAEAGREFFLGNAIVRILGPAGSDYDLENDHSLAIKVVYGDTAFLICGDMEQQGELDLVGSGRDLTADVYVVNHHGSRTSSSEAFLDAVSCTYALISCGSGNRYGHPAMETMERLRSREIRMFRTDRQGTVVAYSDGIRVSFNIDPCPDWTSGAADVGELASDFAGNGDLTSGSADEGELIPGSADGGTLTRGMAADTETSQEISYVCNTHTKKFHYPDCRSVNQIKEKNRMDTSLSREELIAEGYAPCGNCRP